jgi:outer membrane protein assembly factor BamD
MQKMKNLVFVLLLIFLTSSCSEYHKVLNKGKNAERYALAERLYNEEKYDKAIPLFEKVVGPYAGKPQMERIQYMIAKSSYEVEDYGLASYYFTKFINNYPKSSKLKEAAFLGAKSYYMSAPKYTVDQQDTYKALEAFQGYIDDYPNSELSAEANKFYKDLSYRLELKDFEIAKQYYHTAYYVSAITAFDTFNEEHLGSVLKEDALYYKFKSSYELGMNSALVKKTGRLKDAKTAYDKFQKIFPESDRMKVMQNDLDQIDKEINSTNKQLEKLLQNNN